MNDWKHDGFINPCCKNPILGGRYDTTQWDKKRSRYCLAQKCSQNACSHEVPAALQIVTPSLFDAERAVELLPHLLKSITSPKGQSEVGENLPNKDVSQFFYEVSHNVEPVAGNFRVRRLFKKHVRLSRLTLFYTT